MTPKNLFTATIDDGFDLRRKPFCSMGQEHLDRAGGVILACFVECSFT